MSSQKLMCGMSGTCDPMSTSKASLSRSKATRTRRNRYTPSGVNVNGGSGRVVAFYDRMQVAEGTNSSKLPGPQASKPSKSLKEPAPVPVSMKSRTVPL
jgi:hypothetical protein